MTDPHTGNPSDRAASASLGELLSEVARDLSTLIRQEIELAKAELKDSASKAGKGAGMFGGAGVAGHFALLFLSLALMWGLGELIGVGWSSLIIAVIYGVVALILALQGKKQLEKVKGIPRTTETVKKIPEALKPEETR